MSETDNNQFLSLIEHELHAQQKKAAIRNGILITLGALIGIAAVCTVLSTLFFPVAQVHMNSMTPNIYEGDVIILSSIGKIEKGDVAAFRHDNMLMLKRVIALGGETVHVDSSGQVTVDGHVLYEPYINEQSLGECTVEMPFTVPEGKLFLMGDHRATSIDSRSDEIGPIDMDNQIVGKALFRIWPLKRISFIKSY